jgi:hypothetical protein
MGCENCKKSHDGSYGSGRFCNSKCARGFSTKGRRKEISNKVSKTLKGRSFGGAQIQKGTEAHAKWKKKFEETWQRKRKDKRKNLIENVNFEDWPREYIIEYLYGEQDGTCRRCENTHWQGELITLELEHIDGNNRNNKRENVEMLCPNCHSLTDTWRGRNKSCRGNRGRVSDEELLEALEGSSSIRQGLIKVGLSPKGGNYLRCKNLLGKIKE